MVRYMEGKRPEYFEATLQLREVSPEVEKYVRSELARTRIHVARDKKVVNGRDFDLSDSEFTKNLGKRLQVQFGGKYTVSPKLFSNKDGKNIYRLTVLFRGLPCKKGDIISFRGDEYLVLLINKEIRLEHTTTHKKIHLKQKDFHYIKKL